MYVYAYMHINSQTSLHQCGPPSGLLKECESAHQLWIACNQASLGPSKPVQFVWPFMAGPLCGLFPFS